MKKTVSSPKSTNNKNKQPSEKPSPSAIVIYCDGAGSSFDGKGSGFAWIRPQNNERHIERVDGLTNNQAEYRGLLSALNSLGNGSFAQIFTDSQLMCSQVNGNYKVCNTELADLLSSVHDVIKKKSLLIEVLWVPRQKNLAGRLL